MFCLKLHVPYKCTLPISAVFNVVVFFNFVVFKRNLYGVLECRERHL